MADASPVDRTKVKTRGGDSSDSDGDSAVVEALKRSGFRIFGRERPVREVLGGGKPADIILWRDKKVSSAVFGSVTAIWVLFQLWEYHLVSFVCHALILLLVAIFLWSNAITLIQKTPPNVPEVQISEQLAVNIALLVRSEINRAFVLLHKIASGQKIKQFLAIIAGLWFISKIGSCFHFLTTFYIVFVLLHTVPVLYEKYDDIVDSFTEKALEELKKQYAVLNEKYLSKIPRGPLKDKKH